jgi:MFS family permease
VTPTPDRRSSREPWVVVFVVVVTTAVGMMGFGAAFPLITLWIRDLNISHTQAGILDGLWYAPGLLVSLPAGWRLDHQPWRRVIMPAWGFTIGGTALMAVAQNFWVLCVGRLLFAIGSAVHMVGGPKLISTWFEGRKDIGFAMGLYAMSAPIGIFAALKFLGAVGDARGWRPAMYVMTAVTVMGFLLLYAIPAAAPVTAAPKEQKPMAWNPWGVTAWLLGIGYFGYSMGTEGYLTWTADYLVTRGYTLTTASAMVGNYAYASFILKPIFSFFLKRSNAAWFVVIASALAIVSVAMVLSRYSPAIPAFVMGVSLALGMPALYALPPFLFGSEKSGEVFGLYQLLYSFGFAAQWLVGSAIDHAGGYPSGYMVMVLYCLLGPLCLVASRRQEGQAVA